MPSVASSPSERCTRHGSIFPFNGNIEKGAIMMERQLRVGGNGEGGGRKRLERVETRKLFSIPKCEELYDAKNLKMKTSVELAKLIISEFFASSQLYPFFPYETFSLKFYC
jgi:hypothetical protein